MELQSALEERVVEDGALSRRDELVDLVGGSSSLSDTTARDVDDPPRDEENVCRGCSRHAWRRSGPRPDLGSLEPTFIGDRFLPEGIELSSAGLS